jgi:hypothetical protein
MNSDWFDWFVMAGLVPAIHVFGPFETWMPATSAGMTVAKPKRYP